MRKILGLVGFFGRWPAAVEGTVWAVPVRPAQCSNDNQKQYVLDSLYYWYLWNDMLARRHQYCRLSVARGAGLRGDPTPTARSSQRAALWTDSALWDRRRRTSSFSVRANTKASVSAGSWRGLTCASHTVL